MIETIGLMVDVELPVKDLLDRMASAAGEPKWRIVTAAILALAETTDSNGVPAVLAKSAQQPLVATQEGHAA